MSILSLPNELILLIAAAIDSEGQISKLLRTNQRLKKLLLPYLYRRNVECSHSSALLHCCLHGNQQGLEYLLRWKEELKIPDCYGHSPVHLVARDALESTVKQLLEIGTEAHDHDTRKAIGMAIHLREHDRVKWLREHSTKLGDLMHTAVTEGYANAVETLLAHGVPAGYYCDWTGLSTIHLAASYGNKNVVKILVDYGADLEDKAVDDVCEDHGSPLHHAAMSDVEGTVKLLLGLGADVHARDGRGRTPLHEAADGGSEIVISTLLQYGADVNSLCSGRQTPLHAAAIRGEEDSIRILLKHGADIHAEDYKGRTPLDIARSNGREAVIMALFAHGAGF